MGHTPEDLAGQKPGSDKSRGIRLSDFLDDQTITAEAQLHSYFRRVIIQEIRRKLRGACWISQDIATANESVTIQGKAFQWVKIVLPVELGPFSDLPPEAFQVSTCTTRSRFAQLGLEVQQNAGMSIAETITEELIDGKIQKVAFIPVANHAARPIQLPGGTELFYFYYPGDAPLYDEDLKDKLGTDIILSGEEGTDWRWWYEEHADGTHGGAKGIELLLDPNSFKTIPADSEPISISDKQAENHGRESVDRFLEPVDGPPVNGQLYIGETKTKLTIGHSLHGILNQTIATFDGDFYPEIRFYQTNAVIFRGDNTKSRIRVEVFSANGKFPSSVFVSFYRAEGKAANR